MSSTLCWRKATKGAKTLTKTITKAKPAKKKTATKAKTKTTHAVHIVLDRSGSMSNCWESMVDGVNGYVKELAADNEADTKVWLTVFDSGSIDTIRRGGNAKTWREFHPTEAPPRGLTPLLDAVGTSIDKLDKADAKRKTLVVVTDGHENASTDYTNEKIAKLLAARQKRGWYVTYLGADHDSWSRARQMGFASTHTADFSKAKIGETVAVMSSNTRLYTSGASGQSIAYSDSDRQRMKG